VYHKFPTGSHVIYFRSISKSQVEIVRILHESMDVENQLLPTTTSRSPSHAKNRQNNSSN
jgi:toxin ParE1/3/4